MTTLLRSLILVALASAPAAATCLDMEGPPAGASAGVGALVARPDGNVSLRQFQGSTGVWTAGGTATWVLSNYANGSPVQELNLNNINLHVVPNPMVGSATFAYADWGGNVNLRVNTCFANLADLSGAPAFMCGVNVVVTRINLFGYHFGTVTLNGPVNRFAVGGQEFFVDDVCW
jgi:hypothetical protein